jgi:hypothetical protein
MKSVKKSPALENKKLSEKIKNSREKNLSNFLGVREFGTYQAQLGFRKN